MSRFHAAFIGVVITIALAGVAPSATSPAPRPTIVELLDRYAAHDFEAPMALVHIPSDDAAKIADEIDATGSSWTSARGARETPARRLVAATFALDLARVWSVRPFDGRRWLASRRILAWGCAELRKNATPLAGERWWHLAAVGLFEGREDVPALIGNEVPAPIPNSTLIDGARGHLPHALARFPGEPRLRLAHAVAREISTWRVGSEARILREGRLVDAITPPPRDGVLPPEITPEFVAALTEAAGPIKSPRDRQLRLLVDAGANQLARLAVLRESPRLFEALFDVEPVAGEARLRYGFTALRLGDTVNGLTQLRHAEALLSDPVLVYLTRIYLGSAYERQDQPSEAAAAYRRALEVMPGARTASLALTSLLIRDSRVADAYDAAQQLLSQPNAIDPASRYRTGDYRLVFDWLEQLKKVLPSQTPFRARTEIVAVDVLVRSNKVPVTGLTAPDFELRDNGVVQQIDAVRADGVPVDLTLLLDVSGSTRNVLDRFKDEIREIAALLRPDDRVRLLAFAGTTVQVFGFQPGSRTLPLEKLEMGSGATALDDALILALAWVPEPRRRHLVAAFTDGAENSSVVDRRALVAAANRAPALLHVVLPRPMAVAAHPSSNVWIGGIDPRGESSLTEAARATGGDLFASEKSSKILEGFKLAFETFRSGYVLQYTPRGVSRDGWHELAVTVTSPGSFEVRARKGYSGG